MYDWIYNLFRALRERMKSKDLQTAVKNKYENDDGPTKIYRDLGGVVSLRTIKQWVQMLNKTGSIDLSHPPGHPRTVRTKANTSKVKYRLAHKKTVSTRCRISYVRIRIFFERIRPSSGPNKTQGGPTYNSPSYIRHIN